MINKSKYKSDDATVAYKCQMHKSDCQEVSVKVKP